jgi:hypothetical protein
MPRCHTVPAMKRNLPGVPVPDRDPASWRLSCPMWLPGRETDPSLARFSDSLETRTAADRRIGGGARRLRLAQIPSRVTYGPMGWGEGAPGRQTSSSQVQGEGTAFGWLPSLFQTEAQTPSSR